MPNLILSLIRICTFADGAYWDYKEREIPDRVPVILILTGLLTGRRLLMRLLAMLLTAAILLIAAKMTKTELPGGDFKLLCALAFAGGLAEMLLTVLLAGLGAALVSLIRKQPLGRQIPLCTYAAPAYLAVCACKLII